MEKRKDNSELFGSAVVVLFWFAFFALLLYAEPNFLSW